MFPSSRLFALLTALPFTAFGLAPKSATVISTTVHGCNVPITAEFTTNNSAINVVFDTTKSPTGTVLASIDAAGAVVENTCLVCTAIKWTDSLYGFVSSLDYDFWHHLDGGLLEQVDSRAGVEGGSEEGYYETSYVYGGPETSNLTHVQVRVPASGDTLMLSPARAQQSLCIKTRFSVMARGWVQNAAGELARNSKFMQSVNIDWNMDSSNYCPKDRTGDPMCPDLLLGGGDVPACCKPASNATVPVALRRARMMRVYDEE